MIIPRRRRIESKTDYQARLALIKSGKPRLVIRKTNVYLIAQFVESESAKDKVIVSVSSKDLIAKGWPAESKGSLKSLPAAYLTGCLIAKKVSSKNKEAVLDIGLNRSIPSSRIYAVLKGAVDSGLKIPLNPEILPSEEYLAKHKLWKLVARLKEKL